MRNLTFYTIAFQLLLICGSVEGATHHVPSEFATIQEAVNQSTNGDTVIVGPGMYRENVDAKGKGVKLIAEAGESGLEEDVLLTVIDGGANGLPALRVGGIAAGFVSGFTVRNGSPGLMCDNFEGQVFGVIAEENLTDGIRVTEPRSLRLFAGCITRNNKGSGFVSHCAGSVEVMRLRSYRNLGAGVVVSCDRGLNRFSDSLIYENAGAALQSDAPTELVNCSLVNNFGPSLALQNAAFKVRNTIITGNGFMTQMPSGTLDIDYSLLDGGRTGLKLSFERQLTYGLNNIEGDPKFVAPNAEDFHLQDDSPAIGAGGPLPALATRVRSAYPIGSALDLGAFESVLAHPAVDHFDVFAAVEPNRCAGGAEGSIRLYVANGIEPFSYDWSGPAGFTASTHELTGLISGTYQIVVSGGGESVSKSLIVREPAPLRLASTVCGRFPSVSITLKAEGGTPPYQVAWDSGGSELQKVVQLAGSYGVTVTDGVGCVLRKDVVVPQILEPRVIHVRDSGSDSGDGTSEKPFGTIQFAVDNACDGDTVMVGPGTYLENVDAKGKGVKLIAEAGESGLEEDVLLTVIDGGANGLPALRVGGIAAGFVSGFTVRNGSPGLMCDNFEGEVFSVIAEENLTEGITVREPRSLRNFTDCIVRNNRGAGFYSGCAGSVEVMRLRSYRNLGAGVVVTCDRGVNRFVDGLVYENAGAAFQSDVGAELINCSLVNNVGPSLNLRLGTFKVRNTIISGNGAMTKMTDGTLNIDYSLIQGGRAAMNVSFERQLNYGLNNIEGDPKFVSPVTGNFQLQDDSSAIGAADALVAEMAGVHPAIPTGSPPDLGAFENRLAAPVPEVGIKIRWEAFNDHRPSEVTSEHATGYDLGTVEIEGGIKDIVTGDDLQVVMNVAVVGVIDDFGATSLPNVGSPADILFAGRVDLGNPGIPGLRSSGGSKISIRFKGLNPSKRYRFRGTACRGGGYIDRWLAVTIASADKFETAHKDGSLNQNLITKDTFNAASLDVNQAALNTGGNVEGSVIGWDDIDPGVDGTFSIEEEQYIGPAPFGNPSMGPYGYGLNAIYLAEVESSDSGGYAVSGAVQYYTLNRVVPGVNVSLSGDSVRTMSGGLDGAFLFENESGLSQILSATKTIESPVSQGVTTLDIALVRRHVLGIANLDSPYKILAADVNGSSSVTTLDIALIRRVILAIADDFPGGLWAFVPSDSVFEDPLNPWPFDTTRSYTAIDRNLTGQDFIGIKHGDVNGSWTAPSESGLLRSEGSPVPQLMGANPTVIFRVGEAVSNRAGIARKSKTDAGTRLFPVSAAGFREVTSAQFTLEWDPSVMEWVGVEGNGVRGVGEGNFGTRYAADGKLSFSWDDPEGIGLSLDDSTTLFSIVMKTVGGGGLESKVRFSDQPTIREVSVNGELAMMRTEDGSFSRENAIGRGMLFAEIAGGAVRLRLQTERGVFYVIEWSESLEAVGWSLLREIEGDGREQIAEDEVPADGARFYRIRRE